MRIAGDNVCRDERGYIEYVQHAMLSRTRDPLVSVRVPDLGRDKCAFGPRILPLVSEPGETSSRKEREPLIVLSQQLRCQTSRTLTHGQIPPFL
jgi:hypothetical protein